MEKYISNLSQYKWFQWIVNNPKKFYIGAMSFLVLSFIVNMIYGLFFYEPPQNKIIYYPELKIKTNEVQIDKDLINKKMEKIVKELETLKLKRDQNRLQKSDSLRIKYLFNQYQHLKNELQKN